MPSGAVSARLSADAAQVKTVVGDTLSLAVQNLSTIVAALAIAFSANWILAFVILAIVPFLGLQGMAHVKFMTGFSADAKVRIPKKHKKFKCAIDLLLETAFLVYNFIECCFVSRPGDV